MGGYATKSRVDMHGSALAKRSALGGNRGYWAQVEPAGTALATGDLPSGIEARRQIALAGISQHFLGESRVLTSPRMRHLYFAQDQTQVEELLVALGPRLGGKYIRVTEAQLEVYRDAGCTELDFAIPLASESMPAADAQPWRRNLRAAQSNSSGCELYGLKIGLDPGHIGGDWSNITTKYVSGTNPNDDSAVRINEGDITYRLAELLRERLVRRGATVGMTRGCQTPATDLDYDSFDLRPFAWQQILREAYDGWFTSMLGQRFSSQQALVAAFIGNARVKAIFADQDRAKCFIRADLAARTDWLRSFQPDLSLCLHFDAWGRTHRVRRGQQDQLTKAYVAGQFSPGTLRDPEDRMHVAEHLADPDLWHASVGLNESIVDSISDSVGIDRQLRHPPPARRVEDGVYARNLMVSRRASTAPMAFIECALYDQPEEFALLASDGDARLTKYADAILAGVVDWVRNPNVD